MKKILAVISCTILFVGCTKQNDTKINNKQQVIEEAEVQTKKESPTIQTKTDEKLEITGQAPKEVIDEFKVEDSDTVLFQEEQIKPIMVAVMGPMSGKHDMVGNAIIDGAHMALIELFNKNKVPVRITAIDTGSAIEDIEFNISKLDETQFDIILGLTSHDQKAFVEAYTENSQHKPKMIALLPENCGISPTEQINAIYEKDKKVYVVLPMHISEEKWHRDGVTVLQYMTHDVQKTNDDLMKIAQRIEEETRDKQAIVIFTEGNWKLQKFMANADALKLNNRVKFVLASLSNLNSRMESVNEKRHKFGNISVVGIDNIEYSKFIREFHKLHNRKPLEMAFISYNALKQLKDSSFDGDHWNLDNLNCKLTLKLFDENKK